MGPLVVLILLLACAGSQADPTTTTVAPSSTVASPSDDPLKGCALYCFITPNRTERVDFTIYSNLSCTHFVYGMGEMTSTMQYVGPSLQDEYTHSYNGNFHYLKKLKRRNPGSKLLLGVNLAERDSLISYGPSRVKLAASLTLAARDLHADGVFARVDRPFIDNYRFADFFEDMNKTNNSLPVTLGVPTTLLAHSLQHILEAQDHVQAVYLMSTPDLNRLSQVDPLLATKSVPPEQTISYHAKSLSDGGVPKRKIIIGLTAGGVLYTNYLKDSMRSQAEGRLAGTQEICGAHGHKVMDLATASEIIRGEESWISGNAPTEASLGRKVRWLTSAGYGGIGLQSLQHDDPTGECSNPPVKFPALRIVSANMGCAKPQNHTKMCTRMCYMNSDHSLEHLQPTACSHIIVEATLTSVGDVKLSPEGEATARWMRNWHVVAKPRLVISLGPRQTSDIWRVATAVQWTRKSMIRQLMELMNEWGASGAEVSWTAGPLDFPTDAANLDALLVEMREALGKGRQLMMAVTHTATYAGQYDKMPKMNETVDHLVLHTHRFHSSRQPFTGHPGPLFYSSEILPDQRNTIEGLVAQWHVHNKVPRSKLIIGVTAEPLSMMLLGADRADESPFNMAAFPSVPGPSMRSDDGGKKATDGKKVCELEKDLTSRVTFLADIAAPFLVNNGQFVAYENERSVQMKTTWVSLNHLGGLALFDAQLDDPEGGCAKRPFPLLTTMQRAQVCEACIRVDGYEACSTAFTTSCSYRLPTAQDKRPMPSERIPLESCTQIVIEEVLLRANETTGDVSMHFRDETAARAMEKLASNEAPKMGNKRIIVAVRCDASEEGFRKMMRYRGPETVSVLLSFLQKYSLSGVELKCDDLVNAGNREPFSALLRGLSKALISSTPPLSCPHSLSIRLPIYTSDLLDKYEISALNAVKHVVLEPFNDPPKPNTTHINSPLFPANGHTDDIDTTIRAWEAAGLEKSRIIIQIPAYATLEDVASNVTEVGAAAYNERILDQSEVCALKTGESKMLWDRIATYSLTDKRQWLSTQNQDTIAYKIFYAIREGLGGMGLLSLNDDDWAGKCGRGQFPLLTFTKARCVVAQD